MEDTEGLNTRFWGSRLNVQTFAHLVMAEQRAAVSGCLRADYVYCLTDTVEKGQMKHTPIPSP